MNILSIFAIKKVKLLTCRELFEEKWYLSLCRLGRVWTMNTIFFNIQSTFCSDAVQISKLVQYRENTSHSIKLAPHSLTESKGSNLQQLNKSYILHKPSTMECNYDLWWWVILALLASVGPIKARQSAIALSFSKTITNTGPLIIVMEKQKRRFRIIKD